MSRKPIGCPRLEMKLAYFMLKSKTSALNSYRLAMAYSNFFRKHQRILVVDDEAAIMDSLSYALTVEGYEVVTAGNGPAALAAMHRKKPDLVICDYMMPEMTGAQLAMEMRASRKCANIPVILCTGAHIAQAERQASLFDVILTKPYPVPTLLRHIDQLMPATAAVAMPKTPSTLWAQVTNVSFASASAPDGNNVGELGDKASQPGLFPSV